MAYLNSNQILNTAVIINGYNDGYEAGKQKAYDDFWNEFQNNGERVHYDYAFAESTNCAFWSKGFTPKYILKVPYIGSLNGAFINFGKKLSEPIDFRTFLNENNIRFSSETYSDNWNGYIPVDKETFYNANISHLPKLSVGNQLNETFYNCKELVTIEELYMKDNTNGHFSPFYGCNKLENVLFTGVIKGTGINLSSSTKISHDSIISLLNTLYDYSGTTTTRKLTLGTTNLAKLSDEEKAIATDKGWTLA